MQQALVIVQILVAVGLIGLVLLQHGKGADAGASFGSGSSGSIFGARGPSSFLAKITGVLAAAFFVNSVALAYLSGANVDRGTSVVERFQPVQGTGADAPSEVTADSPEAAIPEDGGSAADGAAATDGPADVPAAPATQ